MSQRTEKLVNVKEMAGLLRVSESTVRRLVREKKVPYFRLLGRSTRFDPEQVINALRVEAVAE